jgi:hypothetical protein
MIFNYLGIFITLSPLFITVILVAYFIKLGTEKMSRHSVYWLIMTIILTVFYGYLLFTNSEFSNMILAGNYLAIAFTTYKIIKQKESTKHRR